MSEPIHILSLGAGVQSSTLAMLMACGGAHPMPEAAVFADTQDESDEVYSYLDWLEKQLPFPVYRATAGKLSTRAVELKISAKSGNTYTPIGLPVYTTETVKKSPILGYEESEEDMFDDAPIYGDEIDVVKKGMGRRQCTRTFKIDVINRKINELRGDRPAITAIGISTDEAIRMKPSQKAWNTHVWPLIDLGMSREDCRKWMIESGYPEPPRSACVYCPYHSDAEWLRIKTNQPKDFQRAVDFEGELQYAYKQATALRSTPWLHPSRIPLDQVVFKPKAKEPNLFGNECEGMCGV